MRFKYFSTVILLGSVLALTGCSSEPKNLEDTTDPVEVTQTEALEVVPLEDIKFEATRVPGETEDTIATIAYKDGKPVNIVFDAVLEGEKSKYAEAKAGRYAMGPGSTPWYEQVETLANLIVENNFDLSKLQPGEDMKLDAVTGVTIKVTQFLGAAEKALNSEIPNN